MAEEAKIVEDLSGLTVLEAAELSKLLEEKWGISAAAPVAVAAAGGTAPAAAIEKKSEFDVILTNAGANKISVIKEVSAITSLGLEEAKNLIDGALKPIKEGVSKAEAEDLKAKLERIGAKIAVAEGGTLLLVQVEELTELYPNIEEVKNLALRLLRADGFDPPGKHLAYIKQAVQEATTK